MLEDRLLFSADQALLTVFGLFAKLIQFGLGTTLSLFDFFAVSVDFFLTGSCAIAALTTQAALFLCLDTFRTSAKVVLLFLLLAKETIAALAIVFTNAWRLRTGIRIPRGKGVRLWIAKGLRLAGLAIPIPILTSSRRTLRRHV